MHFFALSTINSTVFQIVFVLLFLIVADYFFVFLFFYRRGYFLQFSENL